MKPTGIAKKRLTAQGIETGTGKSGFESAAEVVQWMGAMQAQDYAMARWAVGVRLPGSTEEDIETALDNGEIIRTHILRPTWHLVSARDIHWMLALSAPHVKAKAASQERALGLDEPLFKRSNAIIRRALEGGKQLTRSQLLSLLEEQGIPTDDSRSTYLMFRAELDGLVCNGPRQGKQFTYALLDERVPGGHSLPREEALALLAGRYFTSHGPATMQDFAWWSGLPRKDIRTALAANRPALGTEKYGEQVYYYSLTGGPAGASSAATEEGSSRAAAGRQVHLLPAFDEYLVSYQDRSPSLSPALFREVFTLNGIFRPIILLNGKIAGTWKRTLRKDKVVIELAPFGELSKTARKGISAAAARYGRFLGLKPEITD